ncbi:hypothetical protein [Burkholderia sp. 9120]|uniref:hypothetical protein n=1 Tax=Burkholderia sp. 9120 TaxID=1500897 RepID=UPI0012E06902|nr:hypothetical protein [Burkholderia sp. 9120]
MSEYLDDGAMFLRRASTLISSDLQREDGLQAMFNVALGIERILKETLWRVNPLYILMNPDFKNSMPVFYEGKIIKSSTGQSDFPKDPDHDVLTYRNSLARAVTCSRVSLDNKGLLYQISEYRDIIAHNTLSLINTEKLNPLLQRDFYPLARAYAAELGVSSGTFLGGNEVRLADLSSKLEVNIDSALERLFRAHSLRWNQLKGTAGFVEDKQSVTQEILTTPYKKQVVCPACQNTAVLYGQPEKELNVFERREVVVGVNVIKLKCQFCKLEIKDYKFLDHLRFSAAFNNAEVTSMTTDTEIGTP